MKVGTLQSNGRIVYDNWEDMFFDLKSGDIIYRADQNSPLRLVFSNTHIEIGLLEKGHFTNIKNLVIVQQKKFIEGEVFSQSIDRYSVARNEGKPWIDSFKREYGMS